MTPRDGAADTPAASDSSAAPPGATYPAIGICGYSGAGKTTLIEALLPRLTERGWRIAVVKQDAHGLTLDREGKDTDRLFRAGADVVIRDPEQVFIRRHDPESAALDRVIATLGAHYDAILVEGHKTTPLPYKVWLGRTDDETCPPEATGVRHILRPTDDRPALMLAWMEEWMAEAWRSTPVYAGILIGGASRRMGRPKHLIEVDGRTWLERTADALRPLVERIVILGAGEIPASLRGLTALPDVEEGGGPLRGMRSALRWAPRAGWLFAPCDTPDLTAEAITWLLSHRAPGVRAILPALADSAFPEPLPGWYDFRMAPMLERARRPMDLAHGPGVLHPQIPSALAAAWRNVNTPADVSGGNV